MKPTRMLRSRSTHGFRIMKNWKRVETASGISTNKLLAYWLLGISLATISYIHERQTDFLIGILILLSFPNLIKSLIYLNKSELKYYIALIILALWSILPLSFNIEGQIIAGLYFLRAICIYLAIRFWISNHLEFYYFIKICITSVSLIVVIGLIELLLYLTFSYNPTTFYHSSYGLRFVGFSNNPNYFAHWLVILLGINIGYYLLPNNIFLNSKKFLLISLMLLSIGCLLTLSRGAWISMILMYLIVASRPIYEIIRFIKIKNRSVITTILVSTIVLSSVTYIAANPSSLERFFELIHGSGANRYEIWSISFDTYKNLPLQLQLFGVGGHQHPYYTFLDHYPHNNYILFLIEYGFLGLSFFLLCLLSIITYYFNSNPKESNLLLIYGFIGTLVFALSNDTFFTVHFWTLIALIFHSAAIRRKREAVPRISVHPERLSG